MIRGRIHLGFKPKLRWYESFEVSYEDRISKRHIHKGEAYAIFPPYVHISGRTQWGFVGNYQFSSRTSLLRRVYYHMPTTIWFQHRWKVTCNGSIQQ